MVWSTSDRRSRLPSDWAERRRRVMVRDGWQCQWRFPWGGVCHAPANQCDHIDPKGGDDESNLRALCEKHHAWKSSREGNAARRAVIEKAKQVVARPPEVDPSEVDVPPPTGRRGF